MPLVIVSVPPVINHRRTIITRRSRNIFQGQAATCFDFNVIVAGAAANRPVFDNSSTLNRQGGLATIGIAQRLTVQIQRNISVSRNGNIFRVIFI